MKNFEIYKNEVHKMLTDWRQYGVTKDGHLKPCENLDCTEDCIFNNRIGSCFNSLIEWLLSEYEDPLMITRYQYELLKKLNEQNYKYLARNNAGVLYAFLEKPIKNNYYWKTIVKDLMIGCEFDVFDFIKWSDEEPWDIKKLLDECSTMEDYSLKSIKFFRKTNQGGLND